LAHDLALAATSELFAGVSEAPAVQSLARRLEHGGVLSCIGISAAAQPFLAALLHYLLPQHTLVVVTEGLKTQESFQQDIATWLRVECSNLQVAKGSAASKPQPATPYPLFYPAWEILPHEDRLPHSDVISDRLETLIALADYQSAAT